MRHRGAHAMAVVIVICLFSNGLRGSNSDVLLPEVHCKPFASAVSVPSPAPQADPEAIQRVQEIDHQANAASYRVLFFGDSLTQKWDTSIWEQHFAPLGAMNA